MDGEATPEQAEAMARYGEALRRAIRAAGLNQKQFATQLCTTEPNVSMIVTGRRLPHVDSARQFAEQLPHATGELNELFDLARAMTPRTSAANGRLPAGLEGLLRMMRQTVLELPYPLRGRQRLSLTTLYVRQSVTSPAETGLLRFRDDGPDDQGIVEEVRRGSVLAEPFDDVFEQHDHLVLEGTAGLGKTTLGRHLVGHYVDALLPPDGSAPRVDQDGLVPLLLPARVLAAHMRDNTWADAVRKAALGEYGTLVAAEVPAALFDGEVGGLRWLIVVDALDEIPDQASREELLNALATRMSAVDIPMRFLVTTRPLTPGETARLHGPQVGFYELQPFDEQALERFAQHWFNPAETNAGALAAAEFLTQVRSAGLVEILEVPLLASIAAHVHELAPDRPLPASRYGLYENYVAKLVDVRAEAAGTTLAALGKELADPAAARCLDDHRPALLERMALAYTSGETPLADIARELLTEHGHTAPPAGSDWALSLAEWLSHTSLLGRQGTRLRFLHQTFAEHLAATALAKALPDTFVAEDGQWAGLVQGLLLADEAAERVLVHYLHRHEPGHALLTWLQRGTRDQRDSAGGLLCQGVPCSLDQLDAYLHHLGQRRHAGGWTAEDVSRFSGLTRHEQVRARLAGLLTVDSVVVELKIVVIDLLRELSPEVRRSAPELLARWTTDTWAVETRLRAAEVLAKLGDTHRDKAVAVLLRVAEERTVDVYLRRDAAEKLARLGGAPLEEAARVLRDIVQDGVVPSYGRRDAAQALAKLGGQYRGIASAALERVATDPAERPRTRRDAIQALAKLGGQHRGRAVELFAALAAEPAIDVDERALTLGALATVDPSRREQAAEELRRLVTDPLVLPGERRQVAVALVELGGEFRVDGVEVLVREAGGPALSSHPRREAIEDLMKLGRKHRVRLAEVLGSFAQDVMVEPYYRSWAAAELAKLGADGQSAAAECFSELFADPVADHHDRRVAARNLAKLGQSHLRQVLAVLDELLGAPFASPTDVVLAATLAGVLDPERLTLAAALVRQVARAATADAETQLLAAQSLIDLGGKNVDDAAALLAAVVADPVAHQAIRVEAMGALIRLGDPYRDVAVGVAARCASDPTVGGDSRVDIASGWADVATAPEIIPLVLGLSTDPAVSPRDRYGAAVAMADHGQVALTGAVAVLTEISADTAQPSFNRFRIATRLMALTGETEALRLLVTDPHLNGLSRRSALADLLSAVPERRTHEIDAVVAFAAGPAITQAERADLLTAAASVDPAHRDAAATALLALATDEHNTLSERFDAADQLAELGDEHLRQAIELVTTLLADPGLTTGLRAAAAMNLSYGRHEGRHIAMPILVELVEHEGLSAELRQETATRLIRFGGQYATVAVPALCRLAADPATPANQRREAALQVARALPADLGVAHEALRRLASDGSVDPFERVAAARSLGTLGRDARDLAADALRAIAEDAGVNGYARHQGIVELARLGPAARSTAYALLSGVHVADPVVALLVEASLARFDPELLPSTAERLAVAAADSAAPAWNRLHAAAIALRLSRFERGRVAGCLTTIATDPLVRAWERRQAAEALAALGSRPRADAVAILAAAIRDDSADPWERAEMIAAWGELVPEHRADAAGLLRSIIDDQRIPAEQRWYAATTALRLTIESREHATRVLTALTVDQSADPDHRLYAAKALFIHAGTVAPAKNLAGDPTLPAPHRALALAHLVTFDNARDVFAAGKALMAVVADEAVSVATRLRSARVLVGLGIEHRELAMRTMETIASHTEDESVRTLARAVSATRHRVPRPVVGGELRELAAHATDEQRLDVAVALTALDPGDTVDGVRMLRDLATDAARPETRLRAAEAVALVVESDAVRVVSLLVPDLPVLIRDRSTMGNGWL